MCTDVLISAEGICCEGGSSGVEDDIVSDVDDDDEPSEEETEEEEEEADEVVVTTLAPETPDVTPCPVCTGGLTVDESTSAGGGNTCADLLIDAQSVDVSSQQCTAMQRAESLCCPPPLDNPCPICTEGLTVDETTALGGGGKTCGDLINDAKNVDESDNECDQMKSVQGTCCPVVAENPCLVCSSTNGLTVDGTTEVSKGVTCNDIIDESKSIESDSTACLVIKDAENTCCPVIENNTAPVENPCQVCSGSNVTDVDEGAIVADGMTCGELLAEALLIDANENEAQCSQMKEAGVSACCPGEIVNPCSVCPDGITADDTVLPTAVEGITCVEFVAEAMTLDADSAACTLIKDAESTCCPPKSPTLSPIADPCVVCGEGITVDESIAVGAGKTCGDLLIDAPLLQATDPDCALMQDSELTCCPTAAENPCPVCVDGITVEETVGIGVGKTCGDLLVDAMNTEESSDTCTTMKTLEETCCPASVPTASPVSASTSAPSTTNSTDDATTSAAPSVSTDVSTSSSAPTTTVGGLDDTSTKAPTSAADVPITPSPTMKWITPEPTTGSPIAASSDPVPEPAFTEPEPVEAPDSGGSTTSLSGSGFVSCFMLTTIVSFVHFMAVV